MNKNKVINIIKEAFEAKPPEIVAAEALFTAGFSSRDIAEMKLQDKINQTELIPVIGHLRDIERKMKKE